jgi:hypothetical protein
MPRRRGRGKRRAPYQGTATGQKVRPVAQAGPPPQVPVPAAKGPAATPVTPRTRPQQLSTGWGLPVEEQSRIIRKDVRNVGIVTAICIGLLIILWAVLR